MVERREEEIATASQHLLTESHRGENDTEFPIFRRIIFHAEGQLSAAPRQTEDYDSGTQDRIRV